MTKGKISQVIGPVVDVEFAEKQVPAIYNALKIDRSGLELTLEVQQHLGEGVVRTVALGSTDGLKRRQEVIDTGNPITVPVGEEVLGRLINVLGEPIDEKEPIKAKKHYPIHRSAQKLTEQETKQEILETGIKVIDLIA